MGRRKRGPNDTVENDSEGTVHDETTMVSCTDYQQFRDRRIKENQERLQKLGILDLSLKLKSKVVSAKRISRNPPEKKPITQPSMSESPPRRSSRLKSLVPVSYVETRPKRMRESVEDDGISIREGSKPEIYTEEDEKLLGDCKTGWTLFVDGYGKDGKRIYDGVGGETCHQCRQKTLGQHTHCCKCNMVQGQFCGDCLYMRYGENVIEANQNPSWICPVCRGICNCSFCRKAKGWMPTGPLYRKVMKLGYKSVAHFLSQSRRSPTNLENSGVEVPKQKPLSMEKSFLHDGSGEIGMGPEGFATSQPQELTYDNAEVEVEKVHLGDKEYVNTEGEVNKDAYDIITNDGMLKEKKEDLAGQDFHTH